MRPTGFTLVELTVGMLLASLAVTMGYGAYGLLLDRRAAGDEVLEGALHAASLRASIEHWVQGVSSETATGGALMTGLDASVDGLPSDELTVLTTGTEGAGPQRIPLRLFIERDPDTPESGLMVEWRESRTQAPRRQVLAPDVQGMDIRYLSGVLGARQWLPSWVSTSVLPIGVEVRLVTVEGRPAHPLLALPIRIHLEGGR